MIDGSPETLMLADGDEMASGGGSGIAVETEPSPAPPRVHRLPPWSVLLHNDDLNYIEDVIETIQELTELDEAEAVERAIEAHQAGVALLLSTHREHAELLQEQFESKMLVVTIEPER